MGWREESTGLVMVGRAGARERGGGAVDSGLPLQLWLSP